MDHRAYRPGSIDAEGRRRTTVPDVGIAMELVPPTLRVEPGKLGCVQVHLTNSGVEACEVSVELPADERDWTWVHPTSCGIAPGTEEVVAVYFKPACGPHPRAGTHGISITARCRNQPEATAAGEETVDVGDFSDVAAVLDPMVAYDPAAVGYTLRLENRGNVPMRAVLSTDDPSGALVVGVDPGQLSAGPGETASAAVAVQARKGLKKGEVRHRVCVLAQVEGGTDLRVEGSFRQQGRKGR